MQFEPEIVKGDLLYEQIVNLVRKYKPKTILEIGSANGLGSTQAFIEGICIAGIYNVCKLYCLEANPDNYTDLIDNTAKHEFVVRYNMTSAPISEYMSEEDIEYFMKAHGYMFNIKRYNVNTVIGWRRNELDMLAKGLVKENGIEFIKQRNGLKKFDMVLMDGSAFCGVADAKRVANADVIIMDDTLDIKNLYSFREIAKECMHDLIYSNSKYRNGCLVIAKRGLKVCE